MGVGVRERERESVCERESESVCGWVGVWVWVWVSFVTRWTLSAEHYRPYRLLNTKLLLLNPTPRNS